MRVSSVFAALFLCASWASSQSPGGMAFDPYGAQPGVYWQPASGLNSPYGWEFHLGAQGGIDNNYLFIEMAAGLGLTTRLARADVLGIINDTQRWVVGDRIYDFDYFDDGVERFGRVEFSFTGPSLSFRLGNDWRIGLGTRFRAMGDARDVDTQLSFYTYDALPEGSRFTIQPGSAQGATWGEVNLNLAKRITTATGELGIGVNLKYIRPFSSARLLVEGETTITKINRGSVGLENSNVQVALTGDLLENDLGRFTGQGVGVDIGFTYSTGELIGPQDQPQLTFGVAVLDLGGMRFDETSEVHRFSADPNRVIVGDDYNFAESGLASLPDAIEQLNSDINQDGSTRGSLEGNGFTLGLPVRTALNVSYQLDEAVGFDGRLLINTPLGPNALRASQGFTANARYSKWWYGGSVSLSFHEFRQINLGLYLRVGPLYFGTDRLIGTVLSRDRLAAGDFYAGLRIHSFKPSERKSRKKRRKRGNSRYNECYQF